MHRTIAIPSALALLVLTAAGSTTAFAQTTKPKPAQPPKPKPSQPVKPAQPPVKGTSQLSGSDGVLGTEYTIGNDNPMNIAVTKVEYRADRIRAGNEVASSGASEKLLVVHFVFHNPNKQETLVRFDTLRFTAVDAAGTNHDYDPNVYQETNGETLNLNLKPGQKVAGYTIIRLSAKGDIEKLLIISPDDKAVRYPLKGKVKPLTPPYADPADKSGNSAIASIPMKLGEVLPLASTSHHGGDPLDITIEKAEYSSAPILDEAPEEGKRFVVVSFTIRNASPTEGQLFRGDTLKFALAMDDGETVEFTGRLLHATQMREFELTLPKDGTTRGRIWFVVPKEAKLKSLVIRGHNDDDRPFVVDIAGIK